jgi:DNA-binding LacI/PurR family transcriptional regulator
VDGVLIFGDQEPGIYVELSRIGIPFVVLDSSRSSQYPSVYVDYSKAAYIATRHLIDLGHRDIAYLSNGTLHDFNTLTLNGFQQATTEAGIALYPNRFQIDLEDTVTVEQCLEKALAGPSRPTAIFCTVDYYALKVIRKLHAMGLRVPEDVSVVGIDDVAVSALVLPGLTTMRVDRVEMIREGLQMLEQMLRGKSCGNRQLPTPELILRETTCPPKK